MLQITIPGNKFYNGETREFITIKETTLRLEHSLIAISKWESKWLKPFFGNDPLTNEQIIDYIRCMTITQNVPEDIYYYIPSDVMEKIWKYIESPMTATTVPSNDDNKINGEIVTSELIYYWMIALNIPWECQTWHLKRLLTLIRVCSFKNQPPKKMSQSELISRTKAINAARRAQYKSRG